MSSVAIKDYPNATFSGFLKRLRPTKSKVTYPRYMAFYLRSQLFRKTMTNTAVMTLRASLNEAIFSYLELLLPEYDDQVKAGDLLFLMNQKIELNNRINAELEAMAKTLYDYWFVQFDFPFDFAQGKPAASGKPYKSSGGKMIYNPTLKREIPAGWDVAVVADVLGKTPSSNKVLNQEILAEGSIPVIDQSQDYICGFTDDITALIKPTQPHVVFGDHTRAVKMVNFEYARGADGTQILLSNNSRMPGYLLYQAVSDIDLSNYGYARHFKFLKDSKIILPNEIIAARYHEVVAPWYEKIKEGIFENQHLMQLRDWLLPMLMNGQVTVQSAAID
jgi:type I restriction enzyme S subunit